VIQSVPKVVEKIATARCAKCNAWLVAGSCSKGCAGAAPPPVSFSARIDKVIGDDDDDDNNNNNNDNAEAEKNAQTEQSDANATANSSGTTTSDSATATSSAAGGKQSESGGVEKAPVTVESAIDKLIAPALSSKEVSDARHSAHLHQHTKRT